MQIGELIVALNDLRGECRFTPTRFSWTSSSFVESDLVSRVESDILRPKAIWRSDYRSCDEGRVSVRPCKLTAETWAKLRRNGTRRYRPPYNGNSPHQKALTAVYRRSVEHPYNELEIFPLMMRDSIKPVTNCDHNYFNTTRVNKTCSISE